MRTNIDIDDATLDAAMKAGSFKTKKEAVDAGLKLLARQAAYREILQWEGRLHWDGDGDRAVAQADRSGHSPRAGGEKRDKRARAARAGSAGHDRR